MSWLLAGIGIYFGWLFAKFLLGLTVVIMVLLLIGIISIPKTIRQWRCKHESFHETMDCSAICNKCGKNLGFIGTWRKNHYETGKT